MRSGGGGTRDKSGVKHKTKTEGKRKFCYEKEVENNKGTPSVAFRITAWSCSQRISMRIDFSKSLDALAHLVALR